MITVINFSHPLTADAQAAIAREYGGGEAEVHDVPVRVDMTRDLVTQTDAVLKAAVKAAGGNILNVDCVVLPGLSVVAALLMRSLPHANIIVIAAEKGSLPPKFMPVQLVPSQNRITAIQHQYDYQN